MCVVSFVVKRWQSSAPHGPAHRGRDRIEYRRDQDFDLLEWLQSDSLVEGKAVQYSHTKMVDRIRVKARGGARLGPGYYTLLAV